MFRTKWFILVVFFFCFSLAAQKEEKSVISIRDSTENSKLKYFAYPYAFYSPETNLAFGGGAMLYFRLDTRLPIKPSKIVLSAYYTINNQYYTKIAPNFYFPGITKLQIESEIIFQKEIAKFYGIGSATPDLGNPDFTLDRFKLYFELARKSLIFKRLNSGLIFDYSYSQIRDYADHPYLKDQSITGYSGGREVGLGMVWNFDKRDNIFFPSKNGFYKFKMVFYNKAIGSDFNYVSFILDLRHYFSFANKHIIAIQYYNHLSTGNPPFYDLPALGGQTKMRGYFEGRYRDKKYITSQIEYRKIVWNRIGFIAFVAIGDVKSDLKRFIFKELKRTYGFGLRYVFDEKEGLNIRVDVGIAKGSSGVYFNMEEVF